MHMVVTYKKGVFFKISHMEFELDRLFLKRFANALIFDYPIQQVMILFQVSKSKDILEGVAT